jgi:hypothetical protein
MSSVQLETEGEWRRSGTDLMEGEERRHRGGLA